MLTAEQIRLRTDKLTASQIGALMSGNEEKILRLWQMHIGDPSYVEEDLSGVWPVRLGEATEALNLEWYKRKHGPISRIGEVVTGKPDWMAATLDAWDDTLGCPVECKNVGGREPLEIIVARYTPQVTWQMMVTGAKQCALSVIMGANEPIVETLTLDTEYAAELMKRAKQFMACVESLTPPVALPAVAAPAVAAKVYQMDGNAEWKAQADRWLQATGAAKIEKEAEKNLKAMVPPDGAKAIGHGIVISRNRGGALALRENKT
jgi:predicted phage-related endonuclease